MEIYMTIWLCLVIMVSSVGSTQPVMALFKKNHNITRCFFLFSPHSFVFVCSACCLTSGSMQPPFLSACCSSSFHLYLDTSSASLLFSSPGRRHPLLPWFQLKQELIIGCWVILVILDHHNYVSTLTSSFIECGCHPRTCLIYPTAHAPYTVLLYSFHFKATTRGFWLSQKKTTFQFWANASIWPTQSNKILGLHGDITSRYASCKKLCWNKVKKNKVNIMFELSQMQPLRS